MEERKLSSEFRALGNEDLLWELGYRRKRLSDYLMYGTPHSSVVERLLTEIRLVYDEVVSRMQMKREEEA